MAEPSPSTQRFRFGLFEFDPQSGELRKQGVKIKLQGQPVEILALLLVRPGKVVTREEFQKKLWPADTFVSFEQSLNAAMRRLRAALGDPAETPRFVETLVGRGYRFIAPVAHGPEPGPPELPAPPAAGTAQDPARRRRHLVLAVAAAAALVAAVLVSGRVLDYRSSTPINSLLVLPLRNLSGDSQQDYFADGMTDALNAHLAGVSALRVIPQTSSLRYKGTNEPLSQIGQSLGVDAVVEGSVLRSAARVRINVQLIQTSPEKRLWGQTYDRDFRDVLTLQIVDEIRVKVTPGERMRLSTASAASPEAHLDYIMGRFYWNKRSEEAVRKAIGYFQRAIEKDPSYALAYAGLADSWVPMAWYAYMPPREVFPQAKAAVTKALQLGPDLAEAHTTLAFISLYYDWDWAAAERQFLRAIELNPNYANAHHWYAEYLSLAGRHEAALQEAEGAQRLDPLSSIINAWVGSRYFFARRYDAAIERYSNVVEMDPNFSPAHMMLGQAHGQKRMFQEAIAESERAVVLSGRSPVYVASLAQVYGAAGRTSGATRLVDELKELSGRRYVASFDMATALLGLGDQDRVLASLEKAADERSPRLLFLMVDPRFDTIRSSPRFRELTKRVGFQTGGTLMSAVSPLATLSGCNHHFTRVSYLSSRAPANRVILFPEVFGGCGSAVLAAAFPNVGIGLLGVSLAFGLTVLTMAFAIGHISGCHLNPAVSVGLMVGKRFPASELPHYIAAQVAGGIAGAAVLYVIASGKAGFSLAGGFASNGFAEHSPGEYSMVACLVAEVVLTFMFLMIILGSTDRRAPQGFAPIAIGLGLTLIHLIGIPVTNLSVNPARSTGPAVFVGGWALEQRWLFWLAPIVGAAIAGVVYPMIAEE